MSELTITAAGFTIQPVTGLPDGAAILRWAYSRPFLTNDNIQVQWGTVNSGFGVEVPCSIADGLITVDQDSTLWTTDNAQDTNPLSIFISAWLLNSRGRLVQQLQIANKSQWVVPVSLAPTTTWAEFSNYNQAVTLYYYNPTFYNAPQTDAQIRNFAATNYASETNLGGVFTSVPPAIASSPVAWITDDPLVRDAIGIQGVDVSDTPPLDGQVLVYNEATDQAEWANQNPGTGNVVSNEVSSVDGEIVLFSGTGGKTIRRGDQTGILAATSGVVGVAAADESTLAGRGQGGGAGALQSISLGSGLSMSGTTLSATGTGGDVTAAANLTDEAIVVGDGGAKGVQTTPVTINPSTGLMAGATVNDPTTAQQPASKNYVDSAVAIVAGSVPLLSGLASGGIVFWESAYTFRVNAATYYIQGILYSSIEQTITLDAADPVLDRIDVIALNTSGIVVKITGTAAAQPSQPDIDPSTQLQLTFVFVGAATTQPAGVSNEDIYIDNAEWTTSTSGSGWNPASTNNPYSGTLDIEGTNVANGAYVQLQRSAPTTLDSFDTLTMFIRSKAAWNNNRVLRVQFFNAGVAVGTAITIATGFWGFNSSTTGVYQLVAIPVAQFVIAAGTQVNQLRITDVGGAIGLFIDNIVLQTNGVNFGPPAQSGITQDQADARYLQRANNLSDLTSASTARTNLGLGTLATQNGTFSGTSSGTNTGDVTLAGALDYLTIAGQVITRGAIDLATDVTGDLPFANLTPATGASVLLGRGDSGAGDFQEITLGTNLSMSGTTLNAASGGGTNPTSTVIPYNNAGTFADSPLIREDANTVAQRNGATTQVFQIYDEFNSATNYQRLQIHKNAGGQFEIFSTNQTASAMNLAFKVNGAGAALLLTTSELRPVTDRGYDLGSSTSNRFNQLFIFKVIITGDGLLFSSGPQFVSGGGGWIQMQDSAGANNLTRISMGPTNTTGVSLTKPASQTYFEARNGDNSAYVGIRTQYLHANPVAFASLPTGVEGMLVPVTDSSTATWGATIAGGGANRVLAYFNGTNWTVAAV